MSAVCSDGTLRFVAGGEERRHTRTSAGPRPPGAARHGVYPWEGLMNTSTISQLEQALVQWRKRAEFVERGEMRYTDRGLYEDYMLAIPPPAAPPTPSPRLH